MAQIPGGTLDPTVVEKFVTPMLVPPVMPSAGTIVERGGKNIDYYEISMKQFQQQILPQGLPPTTVWGYGAKSAQSNRGLLVHNALAHHRGEVEQTRPGEVDQRAGRRRRQLPAPPAPSRSDTALGNPPGGVDGRDSRPDFVETPGPYTGPVPIVTHVHGSSVADDSDGYAEAWYLPDANDIPGSHAREGAGFFAARPPRPTASPGDVASRPSSTRIRTGHRRSGTTITRSA